MMETQFLELKAGKIAYDDSGSGPLVILSPSLGDLRAEYRFLAPLLVQAGYRVASMDLRGHGESSVHWPDFTVADIGADMLALIRHLGGGPATIVGTSKSAGGAVWAAVEAPELVNGLLLIGPAVRDGMPVWQTKLLYAPLFLNPWGPSVWMKYYQTLYPSKKPADFAAYLDTLGKSLRQPGRMAAARKMMTTSNRASEERLGKVKVPTSAMVGSRDPDFKDPAAEAQRIARSMSGKVQIVEGSGHYPHAEMPEVAGDLILSFLKTVEIKRAESHAS
jgi:pimeloyl-ACP methyl ester carboxylesterase